MIDASTRECHGALVTSLARRVGNDVVRRLAECVSAVMTAGAIADDAGVIHASPGKGHGALVAVFAGCSGNDVAWRLAESRDTVVAGRAAPDDASVSELYGG